MTLSPSEKKLLQSLHEKEYFLQQITNGIPDIVYVLDLQKNTVVFTNERAAELLGHENLMLDQVHPCDHEGRIHHLRSCRSLMGNDVMQIDIRLKVKGGAWNWFRIRDAAFKWNEDGSVSQLIGIARDIQEKKLAEEMLAEKNSLLHGILNAPNVGVVVYKAVRNYSGDILDYEFLLTSKAFEQFHDRSDLVGRWVFEEYPGIKQRRYEEWKELVDLGICYTRIVSYSRREKDYWFNLKHSKLNDGFLIIWEEISKDKAQALGGQGSEFHFTYPRS
jgi:PAS domain S-box-containing protein